MTDLNTPTRSDPNTGTSSEGIVRNSVFQEPEVFASFALPVRLLQ